MVYVTLRGSQNLKRIWLTVNHKLRCAHKTEEMRLHADRAVIPKLKVSEPFMLKPQTQKKNLDDPRTPAVFAGIKTTALSPTASISNRFMPSAQQHPATQHSTSCRR